MQDFQDFKIVLVLSDSYTVTRDNIYSIFADGLLINPKVINRAITYLVSSVLLISQVIYR
jgi:hypothetical protein